MTTTGVLTWASLLLLSLMKTQGQKKLIIKNKNAHTSTTMWMLGGVMTVRETLRGII